ncbi:MAG: hypothetical protein IBJ19_15880 [Gemmatimonadaceae bacterium]|nr:hypothetical protein [Gemmatimonadaceae bacterium]
MAPFPRPSSWLLCLALCSASGGTVVRAQSAGQTSATSNGRTTRAALDGVRLMVRPRVGDTLRLMVEQTVTTTQRREAGSAPAYGPLASRATLRSTRIQLFAHSLVEAADLTHTTLWVHSDSLVVGSGDAPDGARPVSTPIYGQTMRMKVTPDGAMRVIESSDGDADLGATLTSMPGLLPAAPVSVGSEWARDMRLPSLPVAGYRVDGVVQARLRLDSLTRDGRQAWISLEGKLHRDGPLRDLPAGTRVVTAGTMRGIMRVDRERAWIMDARTVLEVQSEVATGPAGAGAPRLFDLRIVQRVQVR